MIDSLSDKFTRMFADASSSAYAQLEAQDDNFECEKCGHRTVQELGKQNTKSKYSLTRKIIFYYALSLTTIGIVCGGVYYLGRRSLLNEMKEDNSRSNNILPMVRTLEFV